jgi:glycosyltransferase involved in cell wall biosynthesis
MDVAKLQEIESQIPLDELAELSSTIAPRGESVLLFVGRLQRVKRLDIIIDAVALMNSGGHTVSLVVIGDGPERDRLQEHARSMPTVRFMGAIYDERALAPFFLAADLLVIPGRIGLTCVHSFAYGLPVVTGSDGAGPQTPEYEYVQDGHNGAIVSAMSAQAYADVVAGILEDENRLDALRMGARLSAEQLALDRMVEGVMDAVRFAAKG